jgi:hypothetical protein
VANFIVVFSNETYTPAGQDPVLHNVVVPVDFGVEVTADDLDEYVEQLGLYAMQVWDEVDWTLDEPGWEIVAVELPNGDVVDL